MEAKGGRKKESMGTHVLECKWGLHGMEWNGIFLSVSLSAFPDLALPLTLYTTLVLILLRLSACLLGWMEEGIQGGRGALRSVWLAGSGFLDMHLGMAAAADGWFLLWRIEMGMG